MKRIIMIAAAGMLLGAGAMTDEEIVGEARRIASIAATNSTRAQAEYRSSHLRDIRLKSAATLTADDILDQAGICGYNATAATAADYPFPKIEYNSMEQKRFPELAPVLLAACSRLQVVFGLSGVQLKGATMTELIQILEEYACASNYVQAAGTQDMSGIKQIIQERGVKIVKRKLRSEGKSFVTKDGVNPCQEYLTTLASALDAPRFQGLNEWFENMGLQARIDMSKFPSTEAISKLREDVLLGETDITPDTKRILTIGLGTSGYNAFVKEYNGEE